MVTLQTMDTRAAPMAPMMAAALPPPGVGLPPARSSRNFSMELSVITSANHGFGDGINLFGIQQRIVLLEQPRNTGTMQRQLERAEAQRPEQNLAVLGLAAIALAHAF